jgi:hypothetical protein
MVVCLGGEAKDAYKAIEQMIRVPEHAVSFVKGRVRPVESSDPDTVAKLIGQLDNDSFAEREKAQNALQKMGEGAAPLITKALEGDVTVESRRRMERVLGNCDATSVLGMQHHRTVAVLEWIGTPGARDLLRKLADGAPHARLTTEARAALKRLQD